MGGRSAIHSIGERFGRLTVTGVECGEGAATVTASCECGGTWVGRITPLRRGATTSCGCLVTEMLEKRNTSHGLSNTPEHRTWTAIKNRCYNTRSQDYRLYGAKGIRVCQRWIDSFPDFLEDMGVRPSSGHSIDRINSRGDYEPGNCRWATALVQARNTSRNVRYEYQGREQTVKEWCDELDLPYHSTKSRLTNGWDVEVAFTTPVTKTKVGLLYTAHGKSMTLSDWARHLGIGATTLAYRIKAGWATELIFRV